MSTSNTHQQYLADAGSETRPSMLERAEVCHSSSSCKNIDRGYYDDLFNYLQQFEKLVNASRANKLENLHDPLALMAHTGSSSRTTSPYYVTHPSSVVNYDDDYQGDARTLRTTSSGTAANVQCYNCSEKCHYARICPKPRVRDSKYFIVQMLLAKQDEAGVILTDEHNDFLFADASRMEEIKELSANICLMARIQPANFDSDAGPSYDSAFLSEESKLQKVKVIEVIREKGMLA
ncbi:zinc finger, CCHC-type containing protein [Tanacetum coccineum]